MSGQLSGKCTVCSAAISRDKLMCLAHWKLVPRRDQLAVLNALRAYRVGKTHEKRAIAIERYIKLAGAATQYVKFHRVAPR